MINQFNCDLHDKQYEKHKINIKILKNHINIHVCKQCRQWTKHRRQYSNNTTNPQCGQAWQWHVLAPPPASLCAHTPHRTPHTARRTPAAALWGYGGERRTRVTRDLLPLNGTTSPLCSCRDTKCLCVDDERVSTLLIAVCYQGTPPRASMREGEVVLAAITWKSLSNFK